MTHPRGTFDLNVTSNQTDADRAYLRALEEYFHSSSGTTVDKLRNFAKFVPRADLARMLVRHEIFQAALGVHGHIVECGVHLGGGLLTWAQFSVIHEPINHVRRVVGFDTFSGFASIGEKDAAEGNEAAVPHGFSAPAKEDIEAGLRVFDMTRPIPHIPRVELVAGDACETIPRFLERNPHTVVALLYLDFDVYAPTKAAIEHFLPRMPRGAVIAFDELNHPQWPGETVAVLETVGIRNLRLRRTTYQPQISYAILE